MERKPRSSRTQKFVSKASKLLEEPCALCGKQFKDSTEMRPHPRTQGVFVCVGCSDNVEQSLADSKAEPHLPDARTDPSKSKMNRESNNASIKLKAAITPFSATPPRCTLVRHPQKQPSSGDPIMPDVGDQLKKFQETPTKALSASKNTRNEPKMYIEKTVPTVNVKEKKRAAEPTEALPVEQNQVPREVKPRRNNNVNYPTTVNASKVFDTFIKSILLNGGYLNSEDIYEGLKDQIDVARLQEFRKIQETNRKVKSAIDAYWYGNYIRTYSELEAFVTKSLNGYLKMECSTFAEVGMGKLSKNNQVIKLFELYDVRSGVEISEISRDDVLSTFLRFVQINSRFLRQLDLAMIERDFLQYLRSLFRPNIDLGLKIDFKSLLFSVRKAQKDWSISFGAVTSKYNTNYREYLEQAFETFLKNSQLLSRGNFTSNEVQLTTEDPLGEKYLAAHGVLIRSVHETLHTVMGVETSFGKMVDSLWSCRSEEDILGLRPWGVLLNEKVSSAIDVNGGTLVNSVSLSPLCSTGVILRQRPTDKHIEVISAAVVGLMVFLLFEKDESDLKEEHKEEKGLNQLEITSSIPSSSSATVRAWFKGNLVSDLSDGLLLVLKHFLVRELTVTALFKVTPDPQNAVASIEWRNVRNTLSRKITERSKVKLSKKLSKNIPDSCFLMDQKLYASICTVCILYHRILLSEFGVPASICSAQTVTSVVKLPSDLTDQSVCGYLVQQLRNLQNSEDFSAQAASTGLLYSPLPLALQRIESDLVTGLNLPAFECTRLGGSFLTFFCRCLSMSADKKFTSTLAVKDLLQSVNQFQTAFAVTGEKEEKGEDLVSEQGSEEVVDSNEGVNIEELFNIVLQCLTSAVTKMEFQHSGSQGAADLSVTSEGSFSCAKDLMSELLLEVETSVQTSDFHVSSYSAGPSLLRLIADVIQDPEIDLKQRIDQLVIRTLISTPSHSSAIREDQFVSSQLQHHESNLDSNDTNQVYGHSPQVKISREIVFYALKSFLSSDSCASSYQSMQELSTQCKLFLRSAFLFPSQLSSSQQLVDRSLTEFKQDGLIQFNPSSGTIEIMKKGTGTHDYKHPTLLFESGEALHSQSQDNDQVNIEDQSTVVQEDNASGTDEVRRNLISLIAEAPYGCSCVEFTMWEECDLSARLQCSTVVEFVLREEAALRVLHGGRTVYFVLPGTLDCVPLPTSAAKVSSFDGISSSINDAYFRIIQRAMDRREYAVVAAWCLSASKGLLEESAFCSCLNAFTLQSFEVLGTDALEQLIQKFFEVSFSLPVPASYSPILFICFKALAYAANLTLAVVEQCALDYAEKQNLMTGDSRFLRGLVSIGVKNLLYFPILSEFSRNWATNSSVLLRRHRDANQSTPATTEAETLLSASAVNGTPINTTQGESTPIGSSTSTLVDTSKQSTDQGVVHNDQGVFCSTGEESAAVSDRKGFILDLLQRDFHYTEGGRVRPAKDSSEGSKLQKALDLLSDSLYSSNVHFVMELIQNTDDNDYHPDTVPTIKLQLFPHAVVVFNNEIGFSGANIVAVSNVGGSTKLGQTGYIGQKGIGFKSVFSVSDCPEIHSNGFHVRFNKKVSMLEPLWVEETADAQWPVKNDPDGTYFETCLRLPLSDLARKNLAKLTQNINEVFDGKLILFLNKLQRMVLEDRRTNQQIEHQRVSLSDNWTKISAVRRDQVGNTSRSDSLWLVLREAFCPHLHRNQVKVDTTEVAVAFKFVKTGRSFPSDYSASDDITSVKTIASNQAENGKEEVKLDFSEGLMPIYSYLPTSLCCFRFVVQGDFHLPTNRESILEQNEWNQMLLDKVPSMFARAIAEMAQLVWGEEALRRSNNHITQDSSTPSTDEETEEYECPMLVHQLLATDYKVTVDPRDILSAIPSPSHASTSQGYIFTVIHQIYQSLQAVAFLKSSSNVPCVPSEIVLIHHLSFNPLLLVSEEVLLLATGLRYAHHELGQLEQDRALADALQIKRFDVECVLSCIEYIAINIKPSFNSAGSSDGGNLSLHELAGALLALDAMTRPNHQQHSSKHQSFGRKHTSQSSAHTSIQRNLVPRQVLTNRQSALSSSNLSGYLTPETSQRLRKLRIWPVSDSLVDLESTVVFLQCERAFDSFSKAQQNCMSIFKNRINLLDKRLFDAANSITAAGGEMLEKFILTNFRQLGGVNSMNSKNSLEGECGLKGGIQELTPDLILRDLIFPAYRRFTASSIPSPVENMAATGESVSVENRQHASPTQQSFDEKTELDRLTAAAFLAFFFHSRWSIKLNDARKGSGTVDGGAFDYAQFVREVGVVVPVVTAREKSGSKELTWSSPQLVLVRKFDAKMPLKPSGGSCTGNCSCCVPESEVHLGLDICDSASNGLASMEATTALRQLHWKIVDPLVSSLAFQQVLNPGSTVPSQYTTSEIRKKASGQREDDIKMMKLFLLRLGVVNFFGVYLTLRDSSGNPEFEAPGLQRLIEHLLRNGVFVSVDRQLSNTASGAASETSLAVKEESEVSAEVLSSSTSNTLYVPLFLPSSSSRGGARSNSVGDSAALSVSKVVYDSMIYISNLVAAEVELIQDSHSGGTVNLKSSKFLFDLNTKCWLPVTIHQLIYSVSKTDFNQISASGDSISELYLLCAPADVMVKPPHENVKAPWLLGPHCVYLPQQFYHPSYEAPLKMLRSLFSFQVVSSRYSPSPQLLLGYLCWLSRQGDSTVLANSRLMSWIYSEIARNTVPDPSTAGQTEDSKVLLELLRKDAPLIWIPDRIPVEEREGFSRGVWDYYTGKMTPLSRIVRSDPSTVLCFDESPVKDLSLFYQSTSVECEDEATSVPAIFSRSLYCYSCQAKEGMFGVVGRLPVSHSLPSSVAQHCSCREASDFARFFASKVPLIRKSPSASNLMSVLKFYCSHLQSIFDREGSFAVSLDSLNSREINAKQEEFVCKLNQVLVILSNNIWKCFQIKHCLHPYSADQLKDIKSDFINNKLLLTVNPKSLISLSPCPSENISKPLSGFSKEEEMDEEETKDPSNNIVEQKGLQLQEQVQVQLQIAVDDVDAFSLYESDLQQLSGRVQWIDGGEIKTVDSTNTNDPSLMNRSAVSFLEGSVKNQDRSKYNPEILREDMKQLLELPSDQFHSRVNFIPPETFFAPTNKIPLFDFLGIPKLSDYIEVRWVMEAKELMRHCETAVKFVDVFNKLLRFTHLFLDKNKSEFKTIGLVDLLKSKYRLQALMQMKVIECSLLQRQIRLNLLNITSEKILDVDHHFTLPALSSFSPISTTIIEENTMNCLYLHESMQLPSMQQLSVNLIMKATRIEVALMEVNQHADLMSTLHEKLTRVSKAAATGKEAFAQVMEYEDLNTSLEDESWSLHVEIQEDSPIAVVPLDETTAGGGVDIDSDEALSITNSYHQLMKHRNNRKTPKGQVNVYSSNAQMERQLVFEKFNADKLTKLKEDAQQLSTALTGPVKTNSGIQIASALPHDNTATTSSLERLSVSLAQQKKDVIVEYDNVPGSVRADKMKLLYDGVDQKHVNLNSYPPGEEEQSEMSVVSMLGLIESRCEVAPALSDTTNYNENYDDNNRYRETSNQTSGILKPNENSRSGVSSRSLSGSYTVTARPKNDHTTGPNGADCSGSPLDPQQSELRKLNKSRVDSSSERASFSPLGPLPSQRNLYHDYQDITLNLTNCGEFHLNVTEKGIEVPPSPVESDQSSDVLHFSRYQGLLSGRIGEEVAFAFLKSFLVDEEGNPQFKSIHWVNKEEESGLPFDIEIILLNGDVKHCEVKTRTVTRNSNSNSANPEETSLDSHIHTQWPISHSELHQAREEGRSYCCVFVNLSIDYLKRQVEVVKTQLVGFNSGLINSLDVTQTILLIQLN